MPWDGNWNGNWDGNWNGAPAEGSTGPGFDLETGKRYLGQRVGYKSGKPYFLIHNACPDGWGAGDKLLYRRAGVKGGLPWGAVGLGPCGDDGKPQVGKRYKAMRVGTKDGKPYYLVFCAKCDTPGNPTVCGCEICCTLDATVSVNDGSDAWTAPVDVELTCGGAIEFQSGYCCLNDEVEDDSFCFKYTLTHAEKDTFGAPEAYDTGVTSGTVEQKTNIWSSGDFDVNGGTYKLHYWRTEISRHQTLPTVLETDDCYEGWLLQRLVTSGAQWDTYGDYWEIVESYWNGGSNVYGYWAAATTPSPGIFSVTTDNPYSPEDCPDGFSYSAGDLIPSLGCATYQFAPPFGDRVDNSFSRCPVSLWSETWYSTVATPTCAQKKPCTRVGIFDRCAPQLSCDLETALSGADILDWEVGGCYPNSGSHTFVGDPCGDGWMFNGGTGGMGWEGSDTTFDTGDLVGNEFSVFCDSEDIAWVSSDTRYGRIEAALCCVTPEDGPPYIAAYARLQLGCAEDLPPITACGSVYYAFKTRDLAITFIDGELVVSFTALTPFSSYSPTGSCVCECDPAPSLSLAWRIKVSEC